ncbi:MAG: succinate dehydrogenase, cytochrome b556 subunit [Pseudoxanthomonas sp.]|nr:succinate dehydrogenase, cytochrome b556 subunit [Pseudoxanthomonas sp.]
MATQERPLSPHLQVYKPQLTSFMSILHRGTGVVLALGSLVLALWLVAAAGSPNTYAIFRDGMDSLVGRLALFVFSACLVYHFLNGIRHLVWDAGHGYELPKAYASGYAVLVLSVLLTGGLWFAALSGGAA